MIEPVAAAWFVGLLFAHVLGSGTEAVFSRDRAARQRVAERGLETTLLVLKIAPAVAAVAAAIRAVEPLGRGWPWIAVLAVTPLLVFVGEVAANAVAAVVGPTWARLASGPVTLLHLLLTPLRLVVDGLVALLGRLFQVRPGEAPEGTRETEFLDLIEAGAASGSVAERERDIVEAVFEFGELTVGRLMTPRPDMFAVAIDMPWQELLEKCREAGYSRVPVYQRRTDDILGVLLLKDLIRHRVAAGDSGRGPGPMQIRSLLIPPTFVPQSKPANAMLREFLARKQHMAFVVDEHGTLVGLITLDDLLSELVGEFLDAEDESDEVALTALRPGHWTVKAWMDVEDFVEETGITIPQDGYHTLGGFVFHHLGRLPHKGDLVQHDGHRFMVGAMEGRRIAEVIVTRLSDLGAADRGEAVG